MHTDQELGSGAGAVAAVGAEQQAAPHAGSGAHAAGGRRSARRLRSFFGGVARTYSRWHSGPRTRLLILPALVLAISPLFLAAVLPVVSMVNRTQKIQNAEGGGRTVGLCVVPPPAGKGAGAAATGAAACAPWRSFLDLAVAGLRPGDLAAAPDAILARGWFADNPDDPSTVR
jgi:hypothetical protein